MKTKKLLFLSLFVIIGLFLYMPNTVNATNELNKMEIEIADPKEGEKIPAYANVTLFNDNSKVECKNIELSWEKYDSEGRNPIPLNINDNTLFENNTKYGFDISENSWEIIYKDCEDKGHLFTRATEIYVNGVLIENEQMSFYDQWVWINGVESVDIEVEDLIDGKPLPSTIKYVIKTSTGAKEFVLNCDWVLGDMETEVDENALAKLDEEYIPVVKPSSNPNKEEFDELATKSDFRTKVYVNGELINTVNGMLTFKAKNEVPKYAVSFDANSGVFADGTTIFKFENWNNDEYNYDKIEKPTRDGYTFAGYFTEKTDGISLKSIMQGTGITGNTTFYARWKKNVDKVTVDLTETTDISLSEAEFDAIRFAENKGLLVQQHTPVIIYYYNQDGKFLFSYDRNYSFNFNDELSANDNVKYSISEEEKIIYAEDGNSDVVPNKVEIIFGYYNVTFDANGGKFANSNTTLTNSKWLNSEYNYDSIEKTTRDGYTFKGWYTEKTGGKSLETVMSSEDGIKEDTTFYAQWEENSSAVEPGIPEGGEQEDDNNTGNTDPGNTNTGNTNTGNTNTNKPTGNNPQTGDNIVLFAVIAVIVAVGLAITIKVKKYVK